MRLAASREYERWRHQELRARLIERGVIVPVVRPAVVPLISRQRLQGERSDTPKQEARAPMGVSGPRPDAHCGMSHGPAVSRSGGYVDKLKPAIICAAHEGTAP